MRTPRSGSVRYLLAVGVVLVLIWSGLALLEVDDGEVWLRVERRDLVIGVPTEGELQAVESALIGPPQLARVWNFQISMIAPEGSEVQAGQPVLGFDTTELNQRLRQSVAESDAAAKELERTTTDFDIQRRKLELRLEEAKGKLRLSELSTAENAKIAAARQLEKARIDRRLAEEEIVSLEKLLDQHQIHASMELATLANKADYAKTLVAEQRNAIEQMTVKAPRSGALIVRSDWRGNKKQVGDRAWRAEKILEIPDLSAMNAAAEVDEEQAGRLSVGLPVTLRLDAYPDREYHGEVTLIRRSVQPKSRMNPSKVVKLTVALDETDSERMRPGMRFQGTVIANRLVDVLAVPAECVGADKRGAYVDARGPVAGLFGTRKVYPELGRRNREYVEVLSGLEAGNRVLRRGEDSAR